MIEKIRGGWAKVPDHLKCKSALSAEGLKPGGEAKAEVWNSHMWVQLFDSSEAVPKRKSSEKQLLALAKAREVAQRQFVEANTCDSCREFVGEKNLRRSPEGKTCTWCMEQERFKAMQEEGDARFRCWHGIDFLVLDTETTGLYGSEIVEIGILDRQGEVVFESLVKPTCPIPEDVTAIHGITNEMVADAPTWADIWPIVREILNNRLVLIYKAEFDQAMINCSCSAYGIKPIRLRAKCVMEAYRMASGNRKWVSLSEASGTWTNHRAIGDCRATLEVIKAMWKALGLHEAVSDIV